MEDIRAQAAKTLMVGIAGPELTGDEARRLRELRPAGIVVFRRNLTTVERFLSLVDAVRDALIPDPLLAVDQEGGRVSRLEPWIGPTPSATTLAREGETVAYRFGLATASALRALGLNVDFAPVVDLGEPLAANAIADRAFGPDPVTVTRHASRFLEALQGAGVAGCLKHFPGLGGTCVDSHAVLPADDRPVEALERSDLVPFRELAGTAAAVMVGHASYAALEPESPLPATLSKRIVHGWLRERVGFRGLAVSDDMEMGAVADLDREGAAAVRSVAAGCDLVLYCSDLDRAEAAAGALAREAGRNPEFRLRLESAATAVGRFARNWPAAAGSRHAWDRSRRGFDEFSRLA